MQIRSVALTRDGEEVLQLGSPEARVFNAVPANDDGMLMDELNTVSIDRVLEYKYNKK